MIICCRHWSMERPRTQAVPLPLTFDWSQQVLPWKLQLLLTCSQVVHTSQLCNIPGQHVGTRGSLLKTRCGENTGRKNLWWLSACRAQLFSLCWHSVWCCVALWLHSYMIPLDYFLTPSPLHCGTFLKDLLIGCRIHSHNVVGLWEDLYIP